MEKIELQRLQRIANRKSERYEPIELTTEEVETVISLISTEKPNAGDSYFTWSYWREQCVWRAILSFCLELNKWGYETYFSFTYFSVKKGGSVLYCQYERLLHSYSIPFAIGDCMEIKEDKESFETIFNLGSSYKKIGYYKFSICEIK